jgi:uncharacterized Zn finger protein
MFSKKMGFFRELSWADLAAWSGGEIASRGDRYQKERRVHGLALTPTGGLVAWVTGGQRYATSVDVVENKLVSHCSCPYGYNCKHAVAVILQYAEQVKNKTPLETAKENDERIILLNALNPDIPTNGSRIARENDDALTGKIGVLSKEELQWLIRELANIYPEARKFLSDYFLISSGNVKKIVAATERDILDLSAEPAWKHHWDDMQNLPDYSEVRKRLEMLLSTGHADEVLRLGEQLLEHGSQQVEESDDEGETGEEVATCMDVVFRALPLSSLDMKSRMVWAIDAELKDEFDITRGSEVFWQCHFETSDWSLLADSLIERLDDSLPTDSGSFSSSYKRDRFTDWIVKALEESGRNDECLSLCRKETEKTHSYVRVVRKLLDEGLLDEAETWIRKGITTTADSFPGTAAELRKILLEMRKRASDWSGVSALIVEEYIYSPRVETYKELERACQNAGVWPEVRKHILNFLETGVSPDGEAHTKGKKGPDIWPLPQTGLSERSNSFTRHFPIDEELIDVAIYERKPAEVLRLYDHYLTKGAEKMYGFDWRSPIELKVSSAIFRDFPDRAIPIWKRVVEEEIAITNARAYERAVSHISEFGKLMDEVGRMSEWVSYVSQLRADNKRRPRFLSTLDRINRKKIMEP